MLKKEITYEDFDGETQKDTYYFHLSKAELVEMELSHEGGFLAHLKRIIASNDGKVIVEEFKKMILMSYGKRSADNKSFIKSDELRQDFQQTAAYSALFFELATETGKAVEFVNALVPADISAEAAKAERAAPSTGAELVSSIEDVPAWIREDRTPTNSEAQNMTREQLVEAYKRKNSPQE